MFTPTCTSARAARRRAQRCDRAARPATISSPKVLLHTQSRPRLFCLFAVGTKYNGKLSSQYFSFVSFSRASAKCQEKAYLLLHWTEWEIPASVVLAAIRPLPTKPQKKLLAANGGSRLQRQCATLNASRCDGRCRVRDRDRGRMTVIVMAIVVVAIPVATAVAVTIAMPADHDRPAARTSAGAAARTRRAAAAAHRPAAARHTPARAPRC